jgi:hypothetical protein
MNLPEIGCGGWLKGVRKLPSELPCGRQNPQHYRELHPEIAWVHRTLHATWAQQIEALEQLWSASSCSSPTTEDKR